MPRYRATQSYSSSVTAVNKGDEVEMTTETAEFIERDSPGTLEEVGPTEVEENAVASERSGELLEELRHQQPTIDLDVEDKLKEIPGEGNKRTPAAGFRPPDEQVRIVKEAPVSAKDRMKRGTGNADPSNLADTSANARVTSETPASIAADQKQLENSSKDRTTTDAEIAASLNDDEDDDAKDSTSGTPTSSGKKSR